MSQEHGMHWLSVVLSVMVALTTLAMISVTLVVVFPEDPHDVERQLGRRNESARSMNAMMYATLLFFLLGLMLSTTGNLLLGFLVTVISTEEHVDPQDQDTHNVLNTSCFIGRSVNTRKDML
jgi:hypothetical protein